MATFDRNSDGSSIMKLSKPIKVNGEELSRVTVPALKGKHMMQAPFVAGQSEIPIGQLVTFAGVVVEPVGAVAEMCPEDSLAVAMEVAAQLGKREATGATASP